jgi:transitional endoplasmic reticulum ATPase
MDRPVQRPSQFPQTATKFTVYRHTCDLFNTFLKPCFASTYLPIRKLDIFTVSAGIRTVEFQITECQSESSVRSQPAPRLTQRVSHSSAIITTKQTSADFAAAGPLPRTVTQVLTALFEPWHQAPPGHLHVRAAAITNQTGANFDIINGSETLSKMSGQSEGNLWRLFEDAQSKRPGIFFIDELDSIAPNREKTHGEAKRHVVSQILTLRTASRADRMPSSSRPLTVPTAWTSHFG